MPTAEKKSTLTVVIDEKEIAMTEFVMTDFLLSDYKTHRLSLVKLSDELVHDLS